MAATRDKYRPEQVSERNWTPYITCSLICFYHGNMVSHLGENIIRATGVQYGLTALKNEFKKGWNAVRQAGDKGYGRTDFNAFMKAIGSPVRLDEVKFTRNRDAIRDALDKGHGIAIAGNTRGTPSSSPLRRDVGEADHRIFVKELRKKDGRWETRLYDPMTPQGSVRFGSWVPLSHVFAFGDRFKHYNLYLAERFVSGHYTREAKARRNAAASLLNLQNRVVDLQTELQECRQVVSNKQQIINGLKERVAELEVQVQDLQEQLALCEAGHVDRAPIFLSLIEIEEQVQQIREEITVLPTR